MKLGSYIWPMYKCMIFSFHLLFYFIYFFPWQLQNKCIYVVHFLWIPEYFQVLILWKVIFGNEFKQWIRVPDEFEYAYILCTVLCFGLFLSPFLCTVETCVSCISFSHDLFVFCICFVFAEPEWELHENSMYKFMIDTSREIDTTRPEAAFKCKWVVHLYIGCLPHLDR